jgi:hypothetical protein
MAITKFDARQVISRDTLNRLALASGTELDDLLRSLNAEATPPLHMFATATPNLVLNIGSIKVQNPVTLRNRTIPHIGGLLPAFTSGTITFPASTGGTITVSPGNNGILTCPPNEYVKVTIYLTAIGNLGVVVGASNAVEASAPVPPAPSGTFKIGYVSIFNNAGTIENITNTSIFQMVGGGGGGSGSGNANEFVEEMKIRLFDSYFEYLTPNVIAQSTDTLIDGASTGSYNLVDNTYDMDNTEFLLSVQMFDAEWLLTEEDSRQIEVITDWFSGSEETSASQVSVAIDGTNFETLDMERLGTTERFRGYKVLAEPALANQDEYAAVNENSDQELNASTAQSRATPFTLSTKTAVREITTYLNKVGSPLGTFRVRLVRDSAGQPSTAQTDLIYESSPQSISSLSAGDNTVVLSDLKAILPAGTYWLSVITDAAYKNSFVTSTTALRWRANSAGPNNSSIFNGTTWSTSSGVSLTYLLRGHVYDLRVKVISSAANRKLNGYAVFYAEKIANVVTGDDAIQAFEVDGDANTTSFTITNFLPDARYLKVYDGFTGQVYRYGMFGLNGNAVTFPSGQFVHAGQKFKLIFDQSQGSGFDNSDYNAATIAANHLGSTDPSVDRSLAGRGVLLRRPDGTLVEMRLDNSNNIIFEST